MNTTQAVSPKSQSEAVEALNGGKFLTFKLSREIYGLEILKVHEIIGIMEITRIPKTPEYMRGIINLRGKVIPVMDLRKKFLLESSEDNRKNCIIVVQISNQKQELIMGILVDEVSEVLDIPGEQISEPPQMGESIHSDFVQGIGKAGANVVMLLDIDKILTNQELDTASGLSR